MFASTRSGPKPSSAPSPRRCANSARLRAISVVRVGRWYTGSPRQDPHAHVADGGDGLLEVPQLLEARGGAARQRDRQVEAVVCGTLGVDFDLSRDALLDEPLERSCRARAMVLERLVGQLLALVHPEQRPAA